MTAPLSSNIASKANIPFREFLMLQCLQLRRWALLIAFFLYAIFALLDVLRFPTEVYQLTLSTRFFLVFLPLIILNYIYWFRPPRSITDHTLLLLFLYLGAGLNHTVIHYYAEINQLPFSQLGLVLIIMFGCLLTVLPIVPTLLVTFVILTVYGLSNVHFNHSNAELIIGLLILAVVAGLLLLINHVCQVILRENYHLIKKLYGDSITDGLTSLFNKRFFETQLKHLCLLANREIKTVSLLLIDLDHFKKINDQQGHAVGDKVLQEVALLLQTVCRRPQDYACRVGGDEFAIILYGISLRRLQAVSEELLAKTLLIQLPNDNKPLTVSLSIGGASYSSAADSVNINAIIECADQALYQAKANGRNAYVISI